MTSLRTERFSDPAYLTRVGEGEKVPRVGWAIRFDGDVFYDGVAARADPLTGQWKRETGYEDKPPQEEP